MKFILKQQHLGFSSWWRCRNAEYLSSFRLLLFYHLQRETKPRNLKLFKEQLNALLSNLAICENENEYAELVIFKLSWSQLLHWKFVWLHCVVCDIPLLVCQSFWMCPSGMLLSFLNILYIYIALFMNFICCLVELWRNPFWLSHTFTAVLSMKCLAEESWAVCFRDGVYNRHFSIMIFSCVIFFLIAEISCSMVHQGLERHWQQTVANECSQGEGGVIFFMRNVSTAWVNG